MDAVETVKSLNHLDRLRVEHWSPSSFQEALATHLAQIDTRRELARQLRAHVTNETSIDSFSCGAAAFALGRFRQAIQYLNQIEDSRTTAYLKGLALARLNRGHEALGLLRESIKAHPDRKELLVAEIETLAQIGEVDEAHSRLEAFNSAHPDDVDGLYLRGYIQEHTGAMEDALDTYREVLSRSESHQNALFRLGFALDLYGEDDEAIKVYEQLREARPTFPNAVCNLGVLYEDREEYDKAIRCFQWVLNADPYNKKAELFLKDARASVDMYYDEEQERLEDKFNQILRTPITDFELSVRSRNCLAKMQIESLGDLVQKTESELLSYKNFGETSLAEIKEILQSKGLHLGMSLGMDEEARQAREKAIAIIFNLQSKAPTPTARPGGGTETASPVSEGDPETNARPIGEIAFSMRIKRALANLNVNTLGDFAHHTESEFLSIKNFGQTSLDELKKKIGEYGVTLRKN